MANVKILFNTVGDEKATEALRGVRNLQKEITSNKTKVRFDDESIRQVNTLIELEEKLKKQLAQVQDKSSNTYKDMQKDINLIDNALNKLNSSFRISENLSQNMGRALKSALSVKEYNDVIAAQEKLNQKIAQRKQAANEAVRAEKEALQSLELNARQVGETVKSIFQNNIVDVKGFKESSTQLKYQKELVKETINGMRQLKGAGEEYQHALASINYEAKHTAEKSVYEDVLKLLDKKEQMQKKYYQALKNEDEQKQNLYRNEINNLDKQIEKTNTLAEVEKRRKQNLSEVKSTVGNKGFSKDINQFSANNGYNLEEWNKSGYNEKIRQKQEEIKANEKILAQNAQIEIQERNKANDIKAQNAEFQNIYKKVQQQYKVEEQLAKLRQNPSKNAGLIKVKEQELNKIKEEITLLQKANNLTDEQKSKLQQLTSQHEQNLKEIKAQNTANSANNKSFGETLKNFAKFTVYYIALQKMKQLVNELIDTMKDLDKAFTNVRMVTEGTAEETSQLAQEYNQLAKQMGSTTQEVAEGAVEWLRQGKTAEETTELLKTSMTLSKVGAIESSEATELLTSTLNGYKFEVQDAMSVVDKMTAIDLEAATSTEELAVALSRTANMANNSGVSFSKLLGMIGTVSSVTRRSAETIRRSL